MLMLLPLLAVPACYSVTYSSTIFPFHSVTYRTLMTRYDSRRYIASSPAQECFLLYFPRRCVGFFLVFSERGRSFSLSPNLLSFSRNLVPANTAPPSKVPRKGSCRPFLALHSSDRTVKKLLAINSEQRNAALFGAESVGFQGSK